MTLLSYSETAFEDVSMDDASMIAGIISESGNDEMAAMMFENLTDTSDQNFMSEVFMDVANESPETLIAMATMDQALYENIVYMHDYFMFDKDWYSEFVKFGSDWQVCMNQIKDINNCIIDDLRFQNELDLLSNEPEFNAEFQ